MAPQFSASNVGRYFLSIPSSEGVLPPYPTMFPGATVTALHHHVYAGSGAFPLPGSFSGQKLCFTCLSVSKLAQSPLTVGSQELYVKLYWGYYLRHQPFFGWSSSQGLVSPFFGGSSSQGLVSLLTTGRFLKSGALGKVIRCPRCYYHFGLIFLHLSTWLL